MSLGVYIHIPFCQNKCNYCHFVTNPWNPSTADRYCRAVIKEMEISFAEKAGEQEVNSIYFGGGTPSLVPAEHITRMLSTTRCLFSVSEACEISLEANPGTLSIEKIAAYYRGGVNRISLGAQSFDNNELALLGRNHRSEDITETIRLLRQGGFNNFSLDLILGLPNQTAKTWIRNLEKATALAPSHISIYMLDLDEKCPLFQMIEKGHYCTLGEDIVSDWYLQTVNYLSSQGYHQYEISNFALNSCICHHNLKYWMREQYRGFGLGSHSFNSKSRYANYCSLNDYFQAVETGRSPVEFSKPVTTLQALEETLFLGLRLNRGLDWRQLQNEYESDRLKEYEIWLRDLISQGLIEWEKTIVRLTPSGMLLSNEIFQRFV